MLPTTNQIRYANYLAKRMRVNPPQDFTRQAYSDFISELKPIVEEEDNDMNECGWALKYY